MFTQKIWDSPLNESPKQSQIKSIPAILPDQEESGRDFAMLTAKAKLRGHTLQKLKSGYLLSAWRYCRHFTDIDDLVKVLRHMGVKP